MAAAIIAMIWLGMLIGVSFLATPVKFVVADLSLPVALQVGQATFHLFAKVEWALTTALIGASALAWRTRPVVMVITLMIAGVVLVQALWLLPALDARVSEIVAGGSPAPSAHHAFYAGLEVAKALILMLVAFVCLRPRVAPPR